MSHLVDTSLLVRQADVNSSKRPLALQALQRLPERGLLQVVPQNMMEFWVVAAMLSHGLTHILTFNGDDFHRYASLGITVIDPFSA